MIQHILIVKIWLRELFETRVSKIGLTKLLEILNTMESKRIRVGEELAQGLHKPVVKKI